jgi:hypothetical protein
LLSRSWAHNARLFGMEISPNQVGGVTTSRRAAIAGTRS